MLPTKGYFQDIECPYYNSFCGRPYCHFRHRKKPSETIEEPVEITEKNVIPTYKPTPKSQLESLQTNKSHIPISYVPDLAFRSERQIRPIPRYEKPTYNPTPLSLLSNEASSGKGDEKKISIVNKEYDPLKSEINFEDLTSEFDLIDEIINGDEIQAKFSDDSESDSDANKKSSCVKNSSDSNISKTEKSSDNNKELLRVKTNEKLSSSNKESREKTTKKPGSRNKESRVKTTEKNSSDKEPRVKTTQKLGEKHSSGSDKESQGKRTEKHSDSEKESSGISKKQRNKTEPKKESKDKKDKVILSSSSDSELKKDKKSVPTKSKNSEKIIESSSDSDVKKDIKKSSHKLNEKHLEKANSRDRSSSSSGKRVNEKKDKNSDSEQSEKERSSDKNTKHSSLKELGSGKSSSKEKSSKNKEKEKRGESKEKRSSSTSKNKRDKSEEKFDDKEKHNHTKNKKKDKLDKEQDKSTKKKQKNKERDKDKEKSKDKDKQGIEKERKKSSKDRDKKNDSSKRHKKSDEKDKRDRDKKYKKNQSKKLEKERKSSTTSISSNSSSLGNFDNNLDDIRNVETDNINNFEPEISDIDLDDEDETMRECLKIFNEYKPRPVASIPESSTLQQNSEVQENFSDIMNSKKRTAYEGAQISQLYSKVQPPPKVKTILTPGEALRNRFKVARQAQKTREDDNIMSEIEKIVHTPQQNAKRSAPPSLLEAARQLKIKKTERAEERQSIARSKTSAASLVDDILNGTASSTAGFLPRKKISAAPNVALMQKAKERISRIVARPPQPIKTVAHNQKTSRVAHVPEFSLSEIPDVLQAAKSKLPVNVRTRFLTMIADECVKLYLSRDDAYDRALNEEFACYEKCKVLATYRNSAMLAVNRLRKEIQERESKGLGLIFAGENADADKSNDFEGRKFYNNVARWVLTEEELKLHGYPRDAGERGQVVINNKKERDYSLDENYRRCSRCHKVYQVDDDGWPLYDEECMYHPLKKRTIRGEQVFLCCKSTDDSGCVTSDTHVSDGLDHEQLNGYQTTLPPETDEDARSHSVYALDCEMCYTTKGLELTRVTIVDTDCKTVYESFVKPMNPIIDYNTRFSGITADQMNKTSTSILQVQANILHLCNAKTILVGHSLESDMKALKIVHGTVIDTSVLFPHKMGLPHKRALRALASEYLKKIIQDDVNGHDSAEDAVTCMELVKWKLKEELKVRIK